jgi:hypothetical protein
MFFNLLFPSIEFATNLFPLYIIDLWLNSFKYVSIFNCLYILDIYSFISLSLPLFYKNSMFAISIIKFLQIHCFYIAFLFMMSMFSFHLVCLNFISNIYFWYLWCNSFKNVAIYSCLCVIDVYGFIASNLLLYFQSILLISMI